MTCPIHPAWPNRREDCPFCEQPGDIVTGGQFWGRRTAGGRLENVGATAPGPVDAWICRRVADYPGHRVPAGGAVAPCSKCTAPMVFNPKCTLDAPKVCFQCSGIAPLPIDS
jgi:hypothetical protein